MNNNERMPINNTSEGVMFLLRGAKKRRSMAIANAKIVQGELGVMPKLVALK